jgi:hypothetical protein
VIVQCRKERHFIDFERKRHDDAKVRFDGP